ncbi:EthD domain-containing protein [Halioxenophilus sp. WMMB6]|uniref:EthD domain-containing protein n=1 Tax=Halioxenophilus sp. WMMB6 TaxID=3073815 RepID=UPI00295F4C4E|nr:EthD domain-containing protein [Halioxenophilus sp. WMMB6]
MPTYKILLFMKRKPGLTPTEFRDYYEQQHVPLCSKYIKGLNRYLRRYLEPLPNPETGQCLEPEYDVITELWFNDEALFKGTVNYLSTHTMPDEVIADEELFLDRTKSRMTIVSEAESAL